MAAHAGREAPKESEAKNRAKAADNCLADVFSAERIEGKSQAKSPGDIGVALVGVEKDKIKYDSKSEGLNVEADKTGKSQITDKKTGHKLSYDDQTGQAKIYDHLGQRIIDFNGRERTATTYIQSDTASGSPSTEITQTDKSRAELLQALTNPASPDSAALRKIMANAEGNLAISSENFSLITDRSSGRMFLRTDSGANLMYQDNKLYQLPEGFNFNDATKHDGNYALSELELKNGSGNDLLLRALNGKTSTISLAKDGEINIDGMAINVRSGNLQFASKTGLVTVKSGDGASTVDNAGVSGITLKKGGEITNSGTTSTIFNRYNPADGTINGTNYNINGRIIEITERGHRTVINPNDRYPVSSYSSNLALRFDGKGQMTINGVPIFSSTDEEQEEEKEKGKTASSLASDNQLLTRTMADSINLVALIKSTDNPAERSKILSLLEFNGVLLQDAALAATSAGNLPMVTLYKGGLSQISEAESTLNRTA